MALLPGRTAAHRPSPTSRPALRWQLTQDHLTTWPHSAQPRTPAIGRLFLTRKGPCVPVRRRPYSPGSEDSPPRTQRLDDEVATATGSTPREHASVIADAEGTACNRRNTGLRNNTPAPYDGPMPIHDLQPRDWIRRIAADGRRPQNRTTPTVATEGAYDLPPESRRQRHHHRPTN